MSKPLRRRHSYTKALLSIPSGNRENWFRRALNPPHSYTIAFLKGALLHDYGYGLAQWTYHSRKAALLAYAQERGVSIGDLSMQLGFLCVELECYTSVLKTLKSAKSVREAYTKLSPNNSGQRTHGIDLITPHCVVGQCTAEGLGDWFAKASTQASSNYGVDKDGRVGLYVEKRQLCGRRIETLVAALEDAGEDFTVSLWGSMVEKVTVFEDGLVFMLTSGEEVKVAPC